MCNDHSQKPVNRSQMGPVGGFSVSSFPLLYLHTLTCRQCVSQEKDNYIQFCNMPGIFVGNLKISTNFENLEICRIF